MSSAEPSRSAGPARWRGLPSDGPRLQMALVLLAGLAIRLLWWASTHHTSEDAFITFRFARNLALGHGFTYNLGERVYGTTTPLLTILLAAWQLLSRSDIVLGAHWLDIAASLGSLILLAAVLQREDFSAGARLLTVGVLAISSKAILLDMQGMEMPLVILLLMASWLAYSAGRLRLAGFLAGCLLWARIDLILWPVALAISSAKSDRRGAAELAGTCALTYVPWLLFSSLYFGTAIPHTALAKQVAYNLPHASLTGSLTTVVEYLSPLEPSTSSQALHLAAGSLTLALALVQARQSRRSPAFLALALFAGLEFAALVLTRATFFARYLYPLLWAVFILATLGAASIVQFARQRWIGWQRIAGGLCLVGLVVMLSQARQAAVRVQTTQRYRYEDSLKAIGLWLSERSPESASVLLEPLGYIGYYSGMRMIDEVGLVSPEVVALKLRGVPVEEYFSFFWPDYVVEHCDDAARFEQTQTASGLRFVDHYSRAASFNPLGFGTSAAQAVDNPGLPRGACYVVWQRTGPPPP